MTSARAIEYRITRRLVAGTPRRGAFGLAERTILTVAGMAGLLLLGSLAPGLVVAAVLASVLFVLSF